MQLDLGRLAALEPDHHFGKEVLPQVSKTFDRLRLEVEPLKLELWLRMQRDRLEIAAQYGHPPADLIIDDRVYVRLRGQAWRSASGRIAIENPERQPVEYYAEAFGPGGALLITEGSRDRPLNFLYGAPRASAASGKTTLLWILGGSALLFAGATLVLVATMSHNDAPPSEAALVR